MEVKSIKFISPCQQVVLQESDEFGYILLDQDTSGTDTWLCTWYNNILITFSFETNSYLL